MKLLGAKLDIPNLQRKDPNMNWRIYTNLKELTPQQDKYFGENIEYVHHVSIENCDAWTGNDIFFVGFSLLVEGEIEFYTDPTTKLRYARIYK